MLGVGGCNYDASTNYNFAYFFAFNIFVSKFFAFFGFGVKFWVVLITILKFCEEKGFGSY
jgi:hypothetical protein